MPEQVETPVDSTRRIKETLNVIHLEQLGQLRPANDTAVSIYSPDEGVHAKITAIEVCNTSGEDANFSLYHDNDGTTYTEPTALRWNELVPWDTASEPIKLTIGMDNPDGNLAVKTSIGNALTFTVYGEEYI